MHSLGDRGRRDDDGDVSSDPEQQLKGQGRNKDKEKQKIMIPIGFNIEKGRVRTGG
jgi:hypothetical protein